MFKTTNLFRLSHRDPHGWPGSPGRPQWRGNQYVGPLGLIYIKTRNPNSVSVRQRHHSSWWVVNHNVPSTTDKKWPDVLSDALSDVTPPSHERSHSPLQKSLTSKPCEPHICSILLLRADFWCLRMIPNLDRKTPPRQAKLHRPADFEGPSKRIRTSRS